MAEPKIPTDTPTLHQTALTRWQAAEKAENFGEGSMRHEGEIDLQFLNLQQWTEGDAQARSVALTIDQIGEPYRQLVGQVRGSKPAIQVNPVDNGADVDTAEVFQGLIRHIENTGHAKAAREEAFKGAAGPGWGYYRLNSVYEYEDGSSPDPKALFDQCITYQAIENPFTVWRDPACPLHEPWKCAWAFHIEDIPTEEFQAKYPGKIATQTEAFQSTGTQMADWFANGAVRVADYFYLDRVTDDSKPEMALLADGSVVPLSEAPEGVAIVQRRQPMQTVVRLLKMTAAEILDGEEVEQGQPITQGRIQPWPFIPIVPIYGESLVVKGKRTLKGIVRAARDPQRMYNYQNSELVYELALSPKSKVIMAEGQDEGYEEQWKNAPSQAYHALKYTPKSFNGELVPPPQVAQFTDPAKIQALVIAINQHKADLRSTTGWYDSTDPNRKNSDQSGKAILARKEAQNQSAVTYKENFGAALMFEGMLLIGAIPKVYTRTDRVLRIVGLEDESNTEEVTIGRERKTAKGVQGIFQWGAGRYDVTVSIGTAYQTRRQEAAETGMQLMDTLAKTGEGAMAMAITPDVIRQLDIPNAREMADKAERALPPQLRDQDEDQDDPAALKAQLAQAQMQMQEMGQVIQGLQDAVKKDQVKVEGDLQKTQMTVAADVQQAQASDAVKLQIAREDNATKLEIEERKFRHELELARMKLAAEIEQAHIGAQQAMREQAGEQRHERGMAGAQAGQAALGRHEEQDHADRTAEMAHQHTMEQQAAQPQPGAGV